MKNDMALRSYLLAPTQEEEVVELCGKESPEERVLIKCPWQGRDERGSGGRCHFHRTGDSVYSSTVQYMTLYFSQSVSQSGW